MYILYVSKVIFKLPVKSTIKSNYMCKITFMKYF